MSSSLSSEDLSDDIEDDIGSQSDDVSIGDSSSSSSCVDRSGSQSDDSSSVASEESCLSYFSDYLEELFDNLEVDSSSSVPEAFQPLYPGARVTFLESIVSFMLMVFRGNNSKAEISKQCYFRHTR